MHPIQQRGLRLPFASISSFAAGFAVSVVSGIVIENWVGCQDSRHLERDYFGPGISVGTEKGK